MPNLRQRVIEILQHALDEQRMIAVHRKPHEPDRFDVGYVKSISSSTLVLHCIDAKGADDGVNVVHLDDIIRLHWDTEYLAGVAALHEHYAEVYKATPEVWNQTRDFAHALEKARDLQTAVTLVHYEGSDISGIVREVGEDWIELECVEESGRSDGHYVISLTDIARLEIGREGEQGNLFLYRLRYGMN